jgi:hypothetical protein
LGFKKKGVSLNESLSWSSKKNFKKNDYFFGWFKKLFTFAAALKNKRRSKQGLRVFSKTKLALKC